MSRVTQLSRSVTSAASRASPLLDSTAHAAGVPIMPKYADLLMREHLHDRSITTTHRPTPQPSITNRNRPLMQTFSSSSASKQSNTLDSTILPSTSFFSSSSSSTVDDIRVPLLPDAYSITHPATAAAPISQPEVTIVASDPENVIPGSSLAEVSAAGGADVIDLGFVHSSGQPEAKEESNMLKDLWKGMMDDIFATATPKKA
ncbi:hypothetical protein NLU13_5685 [Sarocladium strictum]|uniref:Uncharacterized protein n=1 Tax=Sarocladium strictum TaxID=5046 RepID=A0AA39GIQ3_SARSR|nr:hypothetical protein NLU13_5685 [Sarocladium strictum]